MLTTVEALGFALFMAVMIIILLLVQLDKYWQRSHRVDER